MTSLRKRLLSMVLTAAMLLGLLPVFSPQATAADTRNAFGLPEGADEILPYIDRDNPYGKAGWFNINPRQELAVLAGSTSDERVSVYSYNKDTDMSASGFKPANGETNRKAFTSKKGASALRLVSSVAFDPYGDGQDKYIASLGFSRDYKLYLHLIDAASGTTLGVTQIADTDGSFAHLESASALNYQGVVALTAGDYNGDGRDTLVIYEPRMPEESKTVAPVLREYAFNGNERTCTPTGAPLEIIRGMLKIPASIGYEKFNTVKTRRGRLYNTPIIQMTSEDTDRDGLDELVVAAGFANLCEAVGELKELGSRVLVYEKPFNQGTFQQSLNEPLGPMGEKDPTTQKGRLRYTGVSVGNVVTAGAAVDCPEIVVAGYKNDKEGAYNSIKVNQIAAYVYQCISSDGNGVSQYRLYLGDLAVELPHAAKHV